MTIQQRRCDVCEEMHDIVMPSAKSRLIKVCLDCYTKLDTKNRKDFGFPEINRNTGTHTGK